MSNKGIQTSSFSWILSSKSLSNIQTIPSYNELDNCSRSRPLVLFHTSIEQFQISGEDYSSESQSLLQFSCEKIPQLLKLLESLLGKVVLSTKWVSELQKGFNKEKSCNFNLVHCESQPFFFKGGVALCFLVPFWSTYFFRRRVSPFSHL